MFRLAFTYDPDLVRRSKDLPFASFDGDTRSWTARVCTQTVQQLRRMWHEGLVDVGPDQLLHDGEELVEAAEAVLRSGSGKLPFYVHFATRGSAKFPAFRAIAGSSWVKEAGALSFPPGAAAALADMVDRGLLDDPDKLLTAAGVTVSFDARIGKFAVRGDGRAAAVFHTQFPHRDVVGEWQARNLDAGFLDAYTEEMYRGELARVGEGFQPDGMKLDLMPYQKQCVALALERSGLGVYLAPGLGKCLAPDTPVWANGELVPIGRLYDEQAHSPIFDGEGEWAETKDELLVHAVDDKLRTFNTPATRLYRQHVREKLRKVTLEDGSTVTITAAHKLLTEHNGWTNRLHTGLRVAIPSTVAWDGVPFDLDVVKLLAWQISEGHEPAGANAAHITQNDVAVLTDLRSTWLRVADRYGLAPGASTIHGPRATHRSFTFCYTSKPWRELLASWGYEWGHRSATKTIPPFVMKGDRETVREFLRHYFAAEGHVGAARCVEMVSASETLMRQMAYLLRRFGIRMTLAKRMKAATNGTNIKRPYWIGTITGMSIRRFAEQIGVADARKQAVLDTLVEVDARTSVETFDIHPYLARAKAAAGDISGDALIAHGRNGASREMQSALKADRRLTRTRALECVTGLEHTLNGDTLAAYEARQAELTERGGKGSTSPRLRSSVEKLRAFATDAAAQDEFRAAVTDLRTAVDADLWWARIVSIEEIDYDGYVYDLEVAGPHNFVAGGVYCHNTATAIATGYHLLRTDQITRVIVVVPAAVRTQWAREIVKFTPTPETDIVVVRGDRKQRAAAYEAAIDAKWLILHYDVLSRDESEMKKLFNGAFVVADEAHRVKNYAASRTKALKALARGARRRMALTGTPVETSPAEWYEVLSGFAVPGALGTPIEFNDRYRWKAKFGGYEGAKNLGELRERSRPYYIRFTKSQVATHLPPLQVQTTTLDPSAAYEAILRRAHNEAAEEIRQAALAKAGAQAVREGRGRINEDGQFTLIDQTLADEVSDGADMTAVGQLRLLCSSPRLINEESAAGKALIASGMVPDEDGPKVDEVRTLCAELLASQQRRHAEFDDAGRAYGTATAEEVTGERIVLFTFSKRMANLLAERLTEDGVPYVMFTGDTSGDARDAAVAAFTDPGSDVIAFIATDAAAEGLNLGTCCSTLVNVDLPWTPSRLAQRSQRIHRLDGKAPHYQVTNLIVGGTMEHGVLKLLEQRSDMADALFGEHGAKQSTVGKRTNARAKSFAQQALEAYQGEHPPPRRRTTTPRPATPTAQAPEGPGDVDGQLTLL